LRLVRELRLGGVTHRIFETDTDPPLIVVEGPSLQSFPRAGMSDEDLELQVRGDRWLREQHPVAMLRPMDGQIDLPDYHEEVRLEEMVEKATPEDHRFLEGWILASRGEMLAMSIDRDGNGYVVSDKRSRYFVEFPEATPFRRLSYVVGKYFGVE
jgi:hypothetical protein